MKEQFKIIIIFVLLLSACPNPTESTNYMELLSNWSFRKQGNSEWLKANVPGTVHTDLLNNKIIEDPFYRLNEHSLQWIDKADWEYKTVFRISKEDYVKDKIELHFLGLDTYAKVFLNDSLILESDNMFRTYIVNCKQVLKEGENSLFIKFESPINKGIEKYDALNYTIPVSNNDLADVGKVEDNKMVSIFTRKAGYHFGWDWGPRLVTSGIWRPVLIKAWNTHTILDLFVQNTILDNDAEMLANIEVESVEKKQNVLVEILVNNEIVEETTSELNLGINAIKIPFRINDPELWWPNGMGDQVLYNIEVRISANSIVAHKKTRVGIRTIKLVTEDDSIGTSFYFKVNGYPVFMKGANYIPQDVFLPRVNEDHYTHILQSAVDANMNMLRVWGGGIYENDIFYEMCDEKGLLVWQDFMFACAMFPGDDSFLRNVKQEAIDNVKRLRNHPSIALWCGNNEILSAWENWGWKNNVVKEQGQEVADIIWKAYDNIFHKILDTVVKQYNPEVSYWPSSPGSAFGKKESRNKGDMHYWGVWWGKESFESYEIVMPRFMSEFGFQSFPEFKSLEKYTKPEDYDIYSEVMKSHQRSTIGNETIEEYMLRDYKKPKDFASFIYVSHLLQASGIEYGIEAQRRNMHRCMGSLYWQINDCWPVASWSGIDCYGKWKALHYSVKDAFKPILLSLKQNDKFVQVFIVSDLLKEITGHLNLRLINFEGKELQVWDSPVKVSGSASHVYMKIAKSELNVLGNSNNIVLVAELLDSKKSLSKKMFYLNKAKDLNLPDPELTFTAAEEIEYYLVTLETKKLAKNIFVSSLLSGNFSDNYFDMLAGDEKKVRIKKEGEHTLEEFKNSLKIITLLDSY